MNNYIKSVLQELFRININFYTLRLSVYVHVLMINVEILG